MLINCRRYCVQQFNKGDSVSQSCLKHITHMKKAALFWSGGKDCAYALYKVLESEKYHIDTLVTTLNRQFGRISMHGIREEFLDKQAEALNIPLFKMWVGNVPTNENYEEELIKTYKQLKNRGVEVIIFGDIFLEDLRTYREDLLKKAGLTGYFPLWGQDTKKLMRDSLAKGFKTITCCVSTSYLDRPWVGKEINEVFLNELPPEVDACGENGEFHTFCFAGPVFKEQIDFKIGAEEYRPLQINTTSADKEVGFWYVDLFR